MDTASHIDRQAALSIANDAEIEQRWEAAATIRMAFGKYTSQSQDGRHELRDARTGIAKTIQIELPDHFLVTSLDQSSDQEFCAQDVLRVVALTLTCEEWRDNDVSAWIGQLSDGRFVGLETWDDITQCSVDQYYVAASIGPILGMLSAAARRQLEWIRPTATTDQAS